MWSKVLKDFRSNVDDYSLYRHSEIFLHFERWPTLGQLLKDIMFCLEIEKLYFSFWGAEKKITPGKPFGLFITIKH